MKKSKDPRAEKIIQAFNDFNPSAEDVLDSFYDEKVEFQDPVVKIKSLAKLKKYYAGAYKNVKSIKFEFHDIKHADDNYFATWTMHLCAKGLNAGKPFPVEGHSVIEFNSKDLVIFHRDYFDMGAMVYEKIPVLGQLIRVLKSQMTHGV